MFLSNRASNQAICSYPPRVVNGVVHHVVDHLGRWCRDGHMDWHCDLLVVSDGVVVRPQRKLFTKTIQKYVSL